MDGDLRGRCGRFVLRGPRVGHERVLDLGYGAIHAGHLCRATRWKRASSPLAAIPALSGPHVQVLSPPSQTGPAWSPDAKRIAFEAGVGEIVTADVESGSRVTINQAIYGYEPVWSPDGRVIAYQCAGDVCVANADGSGNEHRVASGGGTAPTRSRSRSWMRTARVFGSSPSDRPRSRGGTSEPAHRAHLSWDQGCGGLPWWRPGRGVTSSGAVSSSPPRRRPSRRSPRICKARSSARPQIRRRP